MKYLLTISFCGTAYAGWQCQKNAPSVQDTLTKACSELFGCECRVTGCSRTDSGVHAVGFRATVEPVFADSDAALIPPEKLPFALNVRLPEDISVIGCEEADDDFHPRYSARGKTYRYLMLNSCFRRPLLEGRAYLTKQILSTEQINRMNEAAKYFLGTHDFSGFMSSGSSVTDTVRTITDFTVTRDEDLITLSVTGDGFLYNMVRILSGTLLDVGLGKIAPEDIPAIIASKNRKQAGPTLPACGLYLYKVYY